MIQSAEGFAEELSREAHGRGLTTKMSDLIRSRDREIIERCKTVALESGLYSLSMTGGDGNERAHQVMNALDSVLREIS
jgi:hypothetical protein